MRNAFPTARSNKRRISCALGFTGGYTIIKDYVRERERRGQEMFVPLAHPPGHAQAAIRAGCKPAGARTTAWAYLRKPDIQARIQELKAERAKRTGISADDVVLRLAQIGFASIGTFLRRYSDGSATIDLSGASAEDMSALAEYTTEVTMGDDDGDGPVRKTKIKLHNPLPALHDLADHTGVFDRRDKAQATALAEAFSEIMERGSKAPIRSDGGKPT